MFRRKPVDEHTGPLAEFVALRAEILHLGDQQWKATAFLITTTGAVFGFALSVPGRIPLLLIVPFSSYILGTRWLHSQELVKRAAFYIRTELSPKVPGGLGYEQWLRDRQLPFSLGVLLSATGARPTVLAYPALSTLALGAVALWWLVTPTLHLAGAAAVSGLGAWVVGVLLTLLVVGQMWRGATRWLSDKDVFTV